MDLVIMAAGMGSRFGGLKQIEPVGANGEFIIDYSIYDAIKCGFDRVVFIIKEENYDVFRDTIGKRIEDKIEVKYIFQNNDNLKGIVELPKDRVKPLGTAHAILCCKDVVKDKFAIINADDFYGYDAFKVMADFLKNNDNSNEYAMAGYITGNTLTENGAVKRGVCEQKDNYLTKITESSIERINGKIIATPLEGGDSFEVDDDTLVSMNMFAFKNNLFDYLEKRIVTFLEENKNNLDKCEFFIPTVVYEMIQKNMITLEVIKTTAVWHGMTYKEDKDELVDYIKNLTYNSCYPNPLWK